MVDVNPDVNKDSYQFNPIDRVTGLFDAHDRIGGTLEALVAAGIPATDLEVFAGDEGMRKLDASGEEHGVAGKVFRVLESWVSDSADFHAMAAAHLAAGGYVIAALVGTDEALKTRVMELLAAEGAHDVKYWHSLFVEQGQ